MAREIFYTFNASAPPADPTVNSTKYTAPLTYQVGGGYYKAIAREEGIITAVTSKSFERSPTDYIAYYPFSGNTLDDSGNGYNLTNNGASLTTDKDGNVNSAYSFTGNATSYYMINSSPIPTTHSMSISFKLYVRYYGTTNPANSGVGVIMKANDFGYQHDFTVAIANTNSNKSIQFISGNNSGEYKNSEYVNNSLPINSWFSVCIIRTVSNIYFYIDGSLVYTDTIGFTVTDKGFALTVGKNPSNSIQSFDGILDEIKIFNRAVTEAEAILLTTE